MVLCCFLSISECDFIVLLKSLNSELWFFSRVVSLVFSLFMSARMDFGIPDVFGMATCSFDEKKSIPHGPETPTYRTNHSFYSQAFRKIPRSRRHVRLATPVVQDKDSGTLPKTGRAVRGLAHAVHKNRQVGQADVAHG